MTQNSKFDTIQDEDRNHSSSDKQQQLIIDLTTGQEQMIGSINFINDHQRMYHRNGQQKQIIITASSLRVIQTEAKIFRNVTQKIIHPLFAVSHTFEDILKKYPQSNITRNSFMNWYNERHDGNFYLGKQLFYIFSLKYESCSNVRFLFKYIHTMIGSGYENYVNKSEKLQGGTKNTYKHCARQISQFIQRLEANYYQKKNDNRSNRLAQASFKGQVSRNNLKTTMSYLNKNQSKLIFCRKKLDKDSDEEQYINENGFASFNFADLKQQNRQVVSLGKYDPNLAHRTVAPGLNLEGVCKSKGCKVRNQRVWVQKNFGVFHVNYETDNLNCPICHNKLQASSVKSVGYLNAHVKCQGKRVGETTKTEWQDTQKEGKLVKYEGFDPNNSCDWAYLVFTVSKV